jgi:Zn-dependent protease
VPQLTAEDLLRIAILAAVLLGVAFPVHEFCHAWMANRLGDSTARFMGRLTLNPVVHFDLFGGGILLISLLISGGTFGFGAAKPTPVNPTNLRGGRRGEMWVSLAGPVSNLVLAAVAAIPLRLIHEVPGLREAVLSSEVSFFFLSVLFTFLQINLILFIFNLIPVPPLDGWTVVRGLVNPRTAWEMLRIQGQIGAYGMLAVFAVVLLGGGTILVPILDTITTILTGF